MKTQCHCSGCILHDLCYLRLFKIAQISLISIWNWTHLLQDKKIFKTRTKKIGSEIFSDYRKKMVTKAVFQDQVAVFKGQLWSEAQTNFLPYLDNLRHILPLHGWLTLRWQRQCRGKAAYRQLDRASKANNCFASGPLLDKFYDEMFHFKFDVLGD